MSIGGALAAKTSQRRNGTGRERTFPRGGYSNEERVVHRQARRYFLGLLSFGVVAAWATSGLITVVLALLACTVVVHGSRLLSERKMTRSGAGERRPRPVSARPLRDEANSLPLVPDEPSLIVELG